MELKYVSGDDKRFREWLRRYREETVGEPPPEEWLDAYLTHIFGEQGKNRHIWWGEEGGRIVGFAVGILTPQAPNKSKLQGMVGEFFVYPEYRREGVGRRLAEAVIAFLREQGANDIHASVTAGNVRGLRFWEACSFQIARYVLVHRPGLKIEEEEEEEL